LKPADAQLLDYYAAIAILVRPLRLAWLTDDGLARRGIDQWVTGGNDYDMSCALAAAIRGRAAPVDKIFYTTRHHNRVYSEPLFERAPAAVWVEVAGLLRQVVIVLLEELLASAGRRKAPHGSHLPENHAADCAPG
jgi:hypothetical protein